MGKKIKIAFIFLDEIHHLYHFLTIAIELAKKHQAHILTYKGEHEFLYTALKRPGGDRVKVEELPTLGFRALTDKLKKRKMPRKGFWFKKNNRYIINNFDAVVFSDYYHHTLLRDRKSSFPKLIKIPHGVSGNIYSFKKDLLDFDLNLLFGEYYYRQLKEMDLLTENYSIVGYPKLEGVGQKKRPSLFNNDKPVVLYNPHFKEPLSSWYQWGLDILDFFYQQEEYNLIFAPHINLFNKLEGEKASGIPEKYSKAENIHIDLGSIQSVDMTYVKAADIYLGEGSSQVFEFILEPRPCIFLNVENIDYQDDVFLRLWKCGRVINNLSHLKQTLDQADVIGQEYRGIQQELNAENFYSEEGSTPSERAATAIVQFLSSQDD